MHMHVGDELIDELKLIIVAQTKTITHHHKHH
jgi:hypothetical protein